MWQTNWKKAQKKIYIYLNFTTAFKLLWGTFYLQVSVGRLLTTVCSVPEGLNNPDLGSGKAWGGWWGGWRVRGCQGCCSQWGVITQQTHGTVKGVKICPYKTTTVIQYVLALTDSLVISSKPGILKLIISKYVVKGFCMINMVHRVYTTYQCKVLGDDIH